MIQDGFLSVESAMCFWASRAASRPGIGEHVETARNRSKVSPLHTQALGYSKTAICLAAVAGYVDGFALRTLNTFVSFMSGNTASAGIYTGERPFGTALPEAVAILFFLCGTFAGYWISHTKMRYAHRLLLGAAVSLLALFMMLSVRESLNAAVGIALLSLAMGIMNPAVFEIGAEPVNLTFVTGALNKVGSHLATASRKLVPPDAQGPWHTHLQRAGVEGSLWIAFFGGAVLAGVVPKRAAAIELLPAGSRFVVVCFVWPLPMITAKFHSALGASAVRTKCGIPFTY